MDSSAEALKGFVRWLALDGDEIFFFDAESGVGQAVGEVAVVSEEYEPGRVHVKATDGFDSVSRTGDEVGDCSSTQVVIHGRDDSEWFVEEIESYFWSRDGIAIQGHDIEGADFGTLLDH